jgi:hypothetical protein
MGSPVGDTAPRAASSAGGLEGWSPRAAVRPRQVGLCARRAVEDTLAAGDDVFLALAGVGTAILAAVRAWLDAPTLPALTRLPLCGGSPCYQPDDANHEIHSRYPLHVSPVCVAELYDESPVGFH